jgi:hypothetical protein
VARSFLLELMRISCLLLRKRISPVYSCDNRTWSARFDFPGSGPMFIDMHVIKFRHLYTHLSCHKRVSAPGQRGPTVPRLRRTSGPWFSSKKPGDIVAPCPLLASPVIYSASTSFIGVMKLPVGLVFLPVVLATSKASLRHAPFLFSKPPVESATPIFISRDDAPST